MTAPWGDRDLSMDPVLHPCKSSLGEVRQAQITVLIAFQHAKSHQSEQHWTVIFRRNALSVSDGAEELFFFGL